MEGNGGFSSGAILGDAPFFPWEQGIMGHIFGDDPLETFTLPAPVPVGSELQPPAAGPSAATWAHQRAVARSTNSSR